MNEIEEKVKALQEDNRLKIITLEENEQKAKNRPFIDDFKAKSEVLFNNFKENCANLKVEEVEEAFTKLKQDLDDAFRKTLSLIQEEKVDEKISDVLKTMKRGFKIIANDIKSNEKVREVSDRISKKANEVYNDERVQKQINNAKRVSNDVKVKSQAKIAELKAKKEQNK